MLQESICGIVEETRFVQILIKYETESYIGRVNKKIEFMREKWANFQFS